MKKKFIEVTTLINGLPATTALNVKLIIYFKWTPDNVGHVIIGIRDIVIEDTLDDIIMFMLPAHFVELEDIEGNTLLVNFERTCSFGEKISYTEIVLMDKYLPADWLRVKNKQEEITAALNF